MVAGFQFYLWRLPFDWMPGGRLQMPIVPVIMLLMVLAIWRISRAIAGRHWIGSVLACVAALLLASRGFLPTANEEQRVGWRDAQVALGSVKERFTAASKALAVVMEPEDLIFTDVAGAPAYFIRASILDSWGLNDRVIGREGQLLPDPAAPGGYSFWGRVHPEYVASRRPEILLVVTLALDQRIPWADVVHHVHIAHLLREVPDFLEGYRPALIKPRDREDLYVYFLQRSDLPERSIPQDHLDFYTIEYGPATHSPKTLETFASTREDGLE
jgi:hypothetical protein